MSNKYYIKRGDKVRGPISEQRLNELLAEGKLREPDLVSLRNDGGWKPIGKMRETNPPSTRTASPRASKAPLQKLHKKTSQPRTIWILSTVAALVVVSSGTWYLYPRSTEDSVAAGANPQQNELVSQPSQTVAVSSPISSEEPQTKTATDVVSAIGDSTPPASDTKIPDTDTGRQPLPATVDEFLAQEPALNGFPDEIGDKQFKPYFREELILAFDSLSKMRETDPDCFLIVGRISIDIEENLSVVAAPVALLVGGYFFAIGNGSDKHVLTFCAPEYRPLKIQIESPTNGRVVVVGEHRLEKAVVTDQVPVQLRLVDETGNPVGSSGINVTLEPRLSQPTTLAPTEVPGLIHAIGFSQEAARLLAMYRPGKYRGQKLSVGDDGVVRFSTTPGRFRLSVGSGDSAFFAFFINPADFENVSDVNFRDITVHASKICRISQMWSPNGDFRKAVLESNMIVPGKYAGNDSSPRANSPLMRHFRVEQFGEDIHLGYSNSGTGFEGFLLGTEPLESYRTLQFTVDASEGQAQMATAFLSNKDGKLANTQSSSKVRLQLDMYSQLAIKPESVYVLRLKKRSSESQLVDAGWIMFAVSDVRNAHDYLLETGTKHWGAEFASFLEFSRRFITYHPLETDAVNSKGEPLLKVSLRGRDNPLTDEDLVSMSRLTAPFELWLYDMTGFTQAGVNQLASSKYLESLTIQFCDNINDEFVKPFANAENLQSLSLNSKQITDKGVSYLVRIPRLNDVRLLSVPVSDKGLRLIAQIANLQNLAITGGEFSGSGFAAFRQHRNISQITIQFCNSLDVQHLTEFAKINKLQRLVLHKTNIPRSAAESITRPDGSLIVDWSSTSEESWLNDMLHEPSPEIMISESKPLPDVLKILAEHFDSHPDNSSGNKMKFAWMDAKEDGVGLSQFTVRNPALNSMSLRQTLQQLLGKVSEQPLSFRVEDKAIVVFPKNI